MGAVRIAQAVKQLLKEIYPASDVQLWGDPAGDHRADTDEMTPIRIFHAAGLKVRPAPSNDFELRRDAVEEVCRRTVEGRIAMLIDPGCRHLKKAMLGGYFCPRIGKEGSMRWSERPLKNESSHPAEALQYLFLGAGEGRARLATDDEALEHYQFHRESKQRIEREMAARRLQVVVVPAQEAPAHQVPAPKERS